MCVVGESVRGIAGLPTAYLLLVNDEGQSVCRFWKTGTDCRRRNITNNRTPGEPHRRSHLEAGRWLHGQTGCAALRAPRVTAQTIDLIEGERDCRKEKKSAGFGVLNEDWTRFLSCPPGESIRRQECSEEARGQRIAWIRARRADIPRAPPSHVYRARVFAFVPQKTSLIS